MEQKQFRFLGPLRQKLYIIVFGTDTPLGRYFDVALLVAIVCSIIVVMLESIREINEQFEFYLDLVEWIFTGMFTVEYLLRLFIIRRPLRYATSFLGIIDLLALLPTYLTLFVSGSGFLIVIRAIRLLRIFRILKLTRYISEAQVLGNALLASRRKIFVFMGVVLTIAMVTGTMMYVVEGAHNGFTSIPRSIYWAIVTITTVGYGDISPQTALGQTIASGLMLIGYAIIAVPTGIVTTELARVEMEKRERGSRICPNCRHVQTDPDARFCSRCGSITEQVKRN